MKFSVPCLIFSLMVVQHVTPYDNDGQCHKALKDKFSKCIRRSSCWFFLERQPSVKGFKRTFCATPGTRDNDDDPMICCPRQPPPKIPPTVIDIVTRKCKEYGEYGLEHHISADGIDITTKKCIETIQLVAYGNPAPKENYPHMVRIGTPLPRYNNTIRWCCAGTLISERFVLTAAHCVENTESKDKLQVGLITMYNEQYTKPKIFGVDESIIHPNYGIGMKYQNDVALLRLNSTIEIDIDVRPICLPVSSDSLDKKVTIAGWGETGISSLEIKKLLKTITVHPSPRGDLNYVRILDPIGKKISVGTGQTWGTGGLLEGSMFLSDGNKDCERKSPNFNINFNSSSMICAVSGPKANNSHTCQGDSGGPAQINMGNCSWTQVGVTAYGNNLCGDKSIPTVFTKISHYIEWIQKNVWPEGS